MLQQPYMIVQISAVLAITAIIYKAYIYRSGRYMMMMMMMIHRSSMGTGIRMPTTAFSRHFILTNFPSHDLSTFLKAGARSFFLGTRFMKNRTPTMTTTAHPTRGQLRMQITTWNIAAINNNLSIRILDHLQY
jgi:fructose-bisphosphate aldolase class 1